MCRELCRFLSVDEQRKLCSMIIPFLTREESSVRRCGGFALGGLCLYSPFLYPCLPLEIAQHIFNDVLNKETEISKIPLKRAEGATFGFSYIVKFLLNELAETPKNKYEDKKSSSTEKTAQMNLSSSTLTLSQPIRRKNGVQLAEIKDQVKEMIKRIYSFMIQLYVFFVY